MKNKLFTLIFALAGGSVSLVMGQSARINSGTQEVPSHPESVRAIAFPEYRSTGNPEKDELNFLHQIDSWNQHHPDYPLTQAEIARIRTGAGRKELGLAQTTEAGKQNQAQQEINQRLLTERNMGKLWGLPGLPEGPKPGSSADEYDRWIQKCNEWMMNTPEVLAQVKSKGELPEYPYKQDPKQDPDYPVYRDTGNPELDDERYHERKLAYTEKLKQYRSF